jgi:hypothetical protein
MRPPGFNLPYVSSWDKESTLTVMSISIAYFISADDTLFTTKRISLGVYPAAKTVTTSPVLSASIQSPSSLAMDSKVRLQFALTA